MRVTALESVGGFCAHLMAREEPELCLRLRQAGMESLASAFLPGSSHYPNFVLQSLNGRNGSAACRRLSL